MNSSPERTAEEKKLAASIMSYVIRNAANEYPFLRKPLCILKAVPDEDITSFCADYRNIYYAPQRVIELYKKSGKRLVENVVHIVLHSLLLHPSMTCEQDKLFDAAADASVFCMMRSADALTAPMAVKAKLEKIKNLTGSTSAADIYTAACSSPEIKNLLFSVSSVLKADDHSPWYRKDNSKKDKDNSQSNELSGNGDPTNDTVRLIKPSGKDADEWREYLSECKEIAASSKYHGSEHGNMFAEIKKPDRFSRFSYREYIRRFAIDEMICEDPETLDMAMYSWGIENLHDIPIIEFSECRENCSVSDIIIAMDMSGSCSGDIAVNFLRQLYSLFDQLELRGSCNINVITFDTRITNEFRIRSAKDAEKVIREYEGTGWGGTDFNCVFSYADNFSKNNHGRKLRGLFFFTDACGFFPDSPPSYRTTFFIPKEETENNFFDMNLNSVPDWIELVKYCDQ